MVVFPIFLWGSIVYIMAKVIPFFRNGVFVFILLFSAIVFIELDMAWYAMSQRHASWAEIELFLTEDLKDHFGVQEADIIHYISIFTFHFIVFSAILASSILVFRHRLSRYIMTIRMPAVGAVLMLFLSVDAAGSVYMKDQHNNHWQSLIDRNILSPGITPLILSYLFGDFRELDAANSDLTEIASTSSESSLHGNQLFFAEAPQALVTREMKDILILIVEGFNPNLVDAKTMPFFTSLKNSSIIGRNHYSAGNITAYGILGLIFGKPLNFYLNSNGTAQSAFIDLINRHGYASRVISTDLTGYRHMGDYLQNFTRPWLERKDWWKLIDPITGELAQEGPNFILSYYAGTHYPYRHAPKYNRFQPEVPENFQYGSWDVGEYEIEIKNRYRNCLLEADHWLRELFQKIDLENTIIVITGDHGEEFFENGRLSHASYLGEPQIKTPFVLMAPGVKAKTINRITSHLDVMATVLSIAGLGGDMPTGGNPGDRLQSPGYAIVTQNNGTKPPNTWAVITKDRKSVVTRDSGGRLRITGLLDLADRKLEYRINRNEWRRNLNEVAAFQRFLNKPSGKVVFGSSRN